MFTPVFSEHDADGGDEQMGGLYWPATNWTLFLSLPAFSFVSLYPARVIGRYFVLSTPAARSRCSLAVGFLVHAVIGSNSEALAALGHTRTVFYDNAAAVGLDAGLSILPTPWYGILGTATATTVEYALLNLLLTY